MRCRKRVNAFEHERETVRPMRRQMLVEADLVYECRRGREDLLRSPP